MVLRMCSAPALPFSRGQRLMDFGVSLHSQCRILTFQLSEGNAAHIPDEAMATGCVHRAEVIPWITQ